MPFVILRHHASSAERVQQSYRRIRVAIARINSYLQEHVTGIAVLQLFNREARSIARVRTTSIATTWTPTRMPSPRTAGSIPWSSFSACSRWRHLLAYGGFRIRNGALSLGVLVAFFQYGLRFFRPIQDLSEKYNILQAAMAASERIFKLLDTPADDSVARRRRSPSPPPPAAIEFDHVWFAYKDEDWVLRDVSFRIAPGETIAVVGHTGAGKTTLTSLLLRFYDVQRGSIRIGGIDIREFDLAELRRHFGVVLQDPHLFTGTVDEQHPPGHGGSSGRRKSIDAAEQVNLLDFVESLPEGFAQPVRERGSGLSTGQKQLISFARALAHNPRFLILDEATSSVDTETELRVREALERMVEGRTSIVIAHRLSTIQRADRIIVMHKGQLREMRHAPGTARRCAASTGSCTSFSTRIRKPHERVLVPRPRCIAAARLLQPFPRRSAGDLLLAAHIMPRCSSRLFTACALWHPRAAAVFTALCLGIGFTFEKYSSSRPACRSADTISPMSWVPNRLRAHSAGSGLSRHGLPVVDPRAPHRRQPPHSAPGRSFDDHLGSGARPHLVHG